MLSFLEFIEFHDFDLILQEKRKLPTSNKKIIISYSFLNFFFKKKINEKNIYRKEKKYIKKFKYMLSEFNIPFIELSFIEIYKLNENINFNKILYDCNNKSDRIINTIKWIILEKSKFIEFLNYRREIKKCKFVKAFQCINIYQVLSCYNEYLNEYQIQKSKISTISIL